MEEDKKHIADLLADESFINYCKNSSPEDVTFWENYSKENTAQRELVELAKERFLLLFNALAVADLEEQSLRLKSRLNQRETTPVVKMDEWKTTRQGKIFRLLKLSGAAAVLLVAGFFAVRYFGKSNAKGIRVFTAAYGERKNIQLPDGSVVNLNAGSKIEIDGSFGVSGRNVYLEGEAFFDVKHNKNIPFVVHTAAMDVKALGTAFDIKAYHDERITQTSLLRGMVEVTLKENDNRVLLLQPNQKIVWEHRNPAGPANGHVTATKNPLPSGNSMPEALKTTNQGDIKEIAWKENKLIFEDDSFSDIAILLKRWYGVDIDFEDDSIRNYRFTGIFEKEDLQTVLDFLKESRHFNFKMKNGETLTVLLSK